MDAFVVFAKEPVPGSVKTRLTPPLSPEQAAGLYTAFVEDVAATVATAAAPGDRRVLACAGAPGPVLASIAKTYRFETAAQKGTDLGGRMSYAIAESLEAGADSVVLVGSDSPTLPASHLRHAVERLSAGPGAKPGRAVLGPAADGGYWLVGAAGGVPDLFDGIPWSSRDVLAATLSRAGARGIPVDLLPFWYDVDDVEDLRMLDAHLRWSGGGDGSPGSRTAAALAALRASNPAFFLA